MNIALILICIAVYVVVGQPDWLITAPTLPYMASYHVFHAGIFHLTVNSIALYTVFSRRHNDNVRCLILGWLIASPACLFSSVPVIGMSDIIYAVIGLRTPSFRNPWWRTAPVITFFIVTLAMLFIPGIAGMPHIVSLAAGIAVAHIQRLWRS